VKTTRKKPKRDYGYNDYFCEFYLGLLLEAVPYSASHHKSVFPDTRLKQQPHLAIRAI